MENNQSKEEFLYPHSSYRGQVKPENLVFNSNLQEFAQRVSYVCNLETNGKITPVEAYKQIKALWKSLRLSKQQLRIGEDPFAQDMDDDDDS
ncbi:DUF7219 family protein [Gloeothece verrucosa]|uniref:Isopropylmalate/homocitrate/citramalate synthase n=1 Tax=Gloeothece verrucosa (strain PCC 7822) TaxID=497965 RepID=E0U9Z4_GLOV7|nr:hypothetical protein [Gloeothece verrucosa]ADN16186.1 conserved hypothetical protein [Gloeothece verrucosa PCC 7822]